MLYKCAVPTFLSHHLGKEQGNYDSHFKGFAIYHQSETYNELEHFLTDASTKELVGIALGSVGKEISHRQLSNLSLLSIVGAMSMTRKNNLDYSRLVKEGFGYFCRKLMERLTGNKQW